MENRNKNIREYLYQQISDLIKNGLPYPIARIIFIDALYNSTFTVELLGISFCDYYTLLTYKQHENIIGGEEKQDYLSLAYLKNFQDVIALYQSNKQLFYSAIDASYAFAKLNYFGKINYIKNLSSGDNDYLNEICPWHKNDQEFYGGWVDIRNYMKFYQSQKRFYDTLLWPKVRQNIVIPSIIGFLKNLAKLDYCNFVYHAINMIETDYMWSRYLVDNKSTTLTSDVENRFARIACYENNPSEYLLLEILNQPDYMYAVVDSYLQIQMKEEPFLEDTISKEKVESYFKEKYPKQYTKIKETLD